MNRDYLHVFLENTRFDSDAIAQIDAVVDTVCQRGGETALDEITAFYFDTLDHCAVGERLEALAQQLDVPIAQLRLLTVILATERAVPIYRDKGVDDALLWDTFSDIREKAASFRDAYGYYGQRVLNWFCVFLRAEMVRFGCFMYVDGGYSSKTPYTYEDISLQNGDRVRHLHIGGGQPFHKEARLDSLRQAHAHFCPNGERLICTCSTWLLYPVYRKILSPTSNIVSFMDDFDIVQVNDQDFFHDCHRIFGKPYEGDPNALPENTSLQRAFKQHLIQGGKIGTAFGVLIFDGERIVNK